MNDYVKKAKWLYKYSHIVILGMASIIVLGIFTSVLNIFRALTMRSLIDSATSNHINSLVIYLLLLGIIITSDMLMQAVVSHISTKNYFKMYSNMEKSIYMSSLNARWTELIKYHSGDLSTRIVSDVDSVTNMTLNIIPSIISNLVLLIGSFITLLYINTFLALAVALLSPVLIIITRFNSIRLKKLYSMSQKIESKHRSLLNETIQNIVVLKSFCSEKDALYKLTNLQNEKLKISMTQVKYNILNNSLFSLGSWITFFVVFAWGALNLSKGSTTFGTLTALTQLFSNIQYPLLGIASSVTKLVAATSSIDRLIEIEELSMDSMESKATILKNIGFVFDNIGYSYKEDQPILSNIYAKVNTSETVAIIGPSGEGKTTLIRLLLCLVYPQKGSTYIISGDMKFEINPSHRNLISYVPQGNTLFSGSISDNLRFGNKNVTDDELKEVLHITAAWDFIKELNDGLNTIIGEHGLGLSEGQAQRIAIARALLKKSPILILDEATSALDMETELKVLKTIQTLEYKPTCLIITHRPSALEICDRVLKLENGNLIEVNSKTYNEAAAETTS